jgi:uncharacterized membrane protein YesL
MESRRPLSGADGHALPAAPRLGRVLRIAAEDLYYHGVRLVPANLLWGVTLLVVANLASGSILGLVLLVVMVPLTIGLMGLATIVVRDRSLVMSDLVRSIRSHFVQRFTLGIGQMVVLVVAVVDLVVGLQLGGLLGVILSATAFYMLLGIWVVAVAAWPIVMDPVREDEPLRARLRLAVILALAHPVRIGVLALVLAAILAVGTVFAAAIITFVAVYAALVAAHYVLPAADRLEGRQTQPED